MTSSRFNNIHPGLSHQEALAILRRPITELEAASDYYMAASHLVNFPGEASEDALIALVRNDQQEQPVQLARRKAVEVLALLGCERAIPAIGDCLHSDDRYLIENSTWALQELKCTDVTLHQRLQELLADPEQNRRVVVQCLAALGVQAAVDAIAPLQDDSVPGVRGAALAAIARLQGTRSRVMELEDLFTLPNQMDRQSALQDAIDADGRELLPSILQTPVSPVFRMRALKALWPSDQLHHAGLDLLDCLDGLLLDDPQQLVLVHRYDDEPAEDFLIQEFFGTDFSRCYLALTTLKRRDPAVLWPLLWQRWQEEAHNDYGAHYFFIRLWAALSPWPEAAQPIQEALLMEAIASQRPQFLKSKPAAMLAMAALAPNRALELSPAWLDPQQQPFWECRYAALMVIEQAGASQRLSEVVAGALGDPDPFVQAKAQRLIG